jgi:cyclophilin family peptidyl-prolyl cis-trans isomerase
MAETKNTRVLLQTSEGDITIELDAARAPISAENFLRYVDEGFYDGTLFHRVIAGFMIQGGGLTADMREKATHPPIRNEAGNGVSNARGTLAMARTSVVDSATSQFFINLADNDFLDHKGKDAGGYGYAVFGHVAEGMDVVDRIAAVRTGRSGYHEDVPLKPVTIKNARRA